MEESDAEMDEGDEMTEGFESVSESNTTSSTEEERKWIELEEQQEAQKKGPSHIVQKACTYSFHSDFMQQ